VEAPQWRRAEIRQRSPVRLTFRIRSCEHHFDLAFSPLSTRRFILAVEPSERPFETFSERALPAPVMMMIPEFHWQVESRRSVPRKEHEKLLR
jgi:hypothetical protein